MTLTETDLPGVGKRFEIDMGGESQLVVIIHRTGKREVYTRESPEADTQKLLELSDSTAQLLASVLDGSYYQPEKEEQIEAIIADDAIIEWITVPDDGPIAGKSLGEANIRQRTNASVIAIQRADETIASPPSVTTLSPGDTLVAIGSRESLDALSSLVAAGSSADQ